MRLRIVAGTHGGRLIEAPPGRGTRPTGERVREAWFSAMGDRIGGARVADLFAGSGALGIEALSRGAERAHFVESNRAAAAVLRRNLAALELEDRAIVIREDVFRFLRTRAGEPMWDLALADPPYAGNPAVKLLTRFRDDPFAAELWLEHRPGAGVPVDTAAWTRRYGDTVVSGFGSGGAEPPTSGDPE